MATAGVRTAVSETVESLALLDSALDRFGPRRAAGLGGQDDGLAAGKAWWSPPTGRPPAHMRQPCWSPGTRCCWSPSSTAPRSHCSVWSTEPRSMPLLPAQDFGGSAKATPTQHRRNGCPYAVALAVRGVAGDHRPGRRRTGRGRTCPARLPVLRAAVRRTGDDRLRAGRGRVQLPLLGDPETQAVLALLDSCSAGCRTPPRPGGWPNSVGCGGGTGTRSPSSSPPRTIPAVPGGRYRHRRAGRGDPAPAPPGARTARWCPPVAGCCRSWGPGRTWLRLGPPPTGRCPRFSCGQSLPHRHRPGRGGKGAPLSVLDRGRPCGPAVPRSLSSVRPWPPAGRNPVWRSPSSG